MKKKEAESEKDETWMDGELEGTGCNLQSPSSMFPCVAALLFLFLKIKSVESMEAMTGGGPSARREGWAGYAMRVVGMWGFWSPTIIALMTLYSYHAQFFSHNLEIVGKREADGHKYYAVSTEYMGLFRENPDLLSETCTAMSSLHDWRQFSSTAFGLGAAMTFALGAVFMGLGELFRVDHAVGYLMETLVSLGMLKMFTTSILHDPLMQYYEVVTAKVQEYSGDLIACVEEASNMVDDLQNLSLEAVGGSMYKFGRFFKRKMLAASRPHVEPLALEKSLTWPEVEGLVNTMDMTKLLEGDPEGWLEDAMATSVPLLQKKALVALEPLVQPHLEPHFLDWHEVHPVAVQYFNVEELTNALTDLDGFMEKLLKTGPMMIKSAIKKNRDIVSSAASELKVHAEDLEGCLLSVNGESLMTVATKLPEVLGPDMANMLNKLFASLGPAGTLWKLAKMRFITEPKVRQHDAAVDWKELTQITKGLPHEELEKLEKAPKEFLADPPKDVALKIALHQAKPKVEPFVEDYSLSWKAFEELMQSAGSVEDIRQCAAAPDDFLSNLEAWQLSKEQKALKDEEDETKAMVNLKQRIKIVWPALMQNAATALWLMTNFVDVHPCVGINPVEKPAILLGLVAVPDVQVYLDTVLMASTLMLMVTGAILVAMVVGDHVGWKRLESRGPLIILLAMALYLIFVTSVSNPFKSQKKPGFSSLWNKMSELTGDSDGSGRRLSGMAALLTAVATKVPMNFVMAFSYVGEAASRITITQYSEPTREEQKQFKDSRAKDIKSKQKDLEAVAPPALQRDVLQNRVALVEANYDRKEAEAEVAAARENGQDVSDFLRQKREKNTQKVQQRVQEASRAKIEYLGIWKDAKSRAMPMRTSFPPGDHAGLKDAFMKFVEEMKQVGSKTGIFGVQNGHQTAWTLEDDGAYKQKGFVGMGPPSGCVPSKEIYVDQNVTIDGFEGAIDIFGGAWQNAVYRVTLSGASPAKTPVKAAPVEAKSAMTSLAAAAPPQADLLELRSEAGSEADATAEAEAKAKAEAEAAKAEAEARAKAEAEAQALAEAEATAKAEAEAQALAEALAEADAKAKAEAEAAKADAEARAKAEAEAQALAEAEAKVKAEAEAQALAEAEAKAKAEAEAEAKLEAYVSFRFTPTMLRKQKVDAVQVGGIEFRKHTGDILSMQDVRAQNPGGRNPPQEAPGKCVDGKMQTKWLDFNKGPLIITFPSAVRPNAFRFNTANDFDGRDPVNFTMEAEKPGGGGWVMLYEETSTTATPTARHAYTDWFPFATADEAAEKARAEAEARAQAEAEAEAQARAEAEAKAKAEAEAKAKEEAALAEAASWTWTVLYASGTKGDVKRDEAAFNALYAKAEMCIIKRLCEDAAATHKEIYYRRKVQDDGYNAYQDLLVTWTGSGHHTKFDIYSTLEDAVLDRNPWKSCNGNDKDVGFPRDAGPQRGVGNNWVALPGSRYYGRARQNWAFYVPQTAEAAALEVAPAAAAPEPAAPAAPEPAAEPPLDWLRFNDKEVVGATTRVPQGFQEPSWETVDGRRAMKFTGGQRFVVDKPIAPAGNAAYTVELVFKRQPGKHNDYQWLALFFCGTEGPECAANGFSVHQQDGHVSHFWWSNDLAPKVDKGLLEGWVTCRCTWDGQGARVVYVNGSEVGRDNANKKTHKVPSGNALTLGGMLKEFKAQKHLGFHGWISSVSIWDKAIAPEQPPLDWLRFNDKEAVGAATRVPQGWAGPTWENVDGRQAMKFTGDQRLVVDKVIVPSGNAAYTVEVVLKRQSGKHNSFQWLAAFCCGAEGPGESASYGMSLHQQDAQISHWWWSPNILSQNYLTPKVDKGMFDDWVTCRCSWDGQGNRVVYVNGREMGRDNAKKKAHKVASDSPLTLGGLMSAFKAQKYLGFHGWISSVKIWDQAFAPGQEPATASIL
eukprot:TRINITY_DN6741_c0_g1_i4.p1 TRINITY_DN6741_c0_g1~~TRINITY_DN6741_c0_g1_i4.p1  ORF type:complete len:1924 (+),score=515.15 TRINITY_DN6741_c0_g1_i4:1828-7599(+)